MIVKRHKIKVAPKYFEQLYNPETGEGIKRFEIRLNDRDYKVGDNVELEEWDSQTGYTGRKIHIKIAYLLEDCPQYGLFEGYCIFCW